MPVGLRVTFFVVVRPVDLLREEEKRWMCREDEEPEVEPKLYRDVAILAEEVTLKELRPFLCDALVDDLHATPRTMKNKGM